MIGWRLGVWIWIAGCVLCQPLFGASPPAVLEALKQAEKQFDRGAYDQAIDMLQHIPGLLPIIPDLSSLEDGLHAKIMFDLGCCYAAVGDTSLAKMAFKRAFFYDDNISQGFFKNTGDLGKHFKLEREQERLNQTTRLGAVMRSLVLPGWGQIYRGHKQRGRIIAGVTISTFAAWVLQKRDYENALNQYRRILPQEIQRGNWYVNEDGSLYSEFEAQFRGVQSKARRTNQFLFALGGMWLLGVTDAVVITPEQIMLRVTLD